MSLLTGLLRLLGKSTESPEILNVVAKMEAGARDFRERIGTERSVPPSIGDFKPTGTPVALNKSNEIIHS